MILSGLIGLWVQVNAFMKGGGTDAPGDDSSDEEETRPSVSYDDMWAKTLLDGSDSSVIMTTRKIWQAGVGLCFNY